jgi:hypothetical protein
MTEWSAVQAALTDPRGQRTPAEFLAGGRSAVGWPGLYTWWVDEAGAADLTAGLGSPVRVGLIYAGQAGATRWPSGTTSAATLWSRISRNHLGGNVRSSTFRRTLAAVLSDVLDLDDRDDPKLQEWIRGHLRVIAVPVDDADGLKSLEAAMLAALNPPLNLDDRPATPLRSRLSELRVPRQRPEDDADDEESADLPADGGRPALTPQVAERRERQRRQEVSAPRLCPACLIELPLSGLCDTCG